MTRLKTDWVLLWTIAVMVCFGLVMVYSASSVSAQMNDKSPYFFLLRQGAWVGLSIVILMIFKRLNYRELCTPTWAFVPLGVVLPMLVAVYFLDPTRHRWFKWNGLSLQPSELAKPALIIFLAYFISRRSKAINDKHTVMPALLVLGLLSLLVVVADLGTALVLVLTAAILFFVAGLRRQTLVMGGIGLVVLGGIAIAAKPYRLDRLIEAIDPGYKITNKLNPGGQIQKYAKSSLASRDPNYQAKQSRIAIGTGGAFGVGIMNGHAKLAYLPEAHTDFIYAVIGEELGILGCSGVLFGFFIILWRGVSVFWTAPDEFGRYLALGATVIVVLQALINIAVVLDMGPTKGIPLPMISHGGSSLIATLTSLGMLLSVSEQSA